MDKCKDYKNQHRYASGQKRHNYCEIWLEELFVLVIDSKDVLPKKEKVSRSDYKIKNDFYF